MPLINRRDALIAAVALALAGALYFAFGRTARNADTVAIYVGTGSEPYMTVPLDEDRIIDIPQHDGMLNRVEIKDGGVRMLYSTCPNQNCVHQGFITPDSAQSDALGGWIICLPNGVSVHLCGRSGDAS